MSLVEIAARLILFTIMFGCTVQFLRTYIGFELGFCIVAGAFFSLVLCFWLSPLLLICVLCAEFFFVRTEMLNLFEQRITRGVTEEERDRAARAVRGMDDIVGQCGSIAQTLIDFEREVFHIRSDWIKARRQALVASRAVIRHIPRLANGRSSEAVSRSRLQAEEMQKCCRKCLEVNQERLANEQGFRCLVKEMEKKMQRKNKSATRFTLGKDGRIIDHG